MTFFLRRLVALLALFAGVLAASPAHAQFGALKRRAAAAVAGAVTGQHPDTTHAQPAAGQPAAAPAEGGSHNGGGMGAMGGMLGRQMMAQMAPLMNQMMTTMFAMAFHSGSYSFEERAYQPGEWTRWKILTDDSDTTYLERAFIGRDSARNEWWRVQYVTGKGADQDTMTLEGLFKADRSEILRMRTRMPDQPQAQELPVQQNSFGWSAPMTLTAASVAGATLGSERVAVPAGSFQARHVRYGDVTGGTLDWWLDGSVPGGMVKYSLTGAPEGGAPGKNEWTMELVAKGTGAKSLLGVM